MTEIGKTLVSPSQLICMDSKTRDILSISVISADLRIKSAQESGVMDHHLRCMCFSECQIDVWNISEFDGLTYVYTWYTIFPRMRKWDESLRVFFLRENSEDFQQKMNKNHARLGLYKVRWVFDLPGRLAARQDGRRFHSFMTQHSGNPLLPREN